VLDLRLFMSGILDRLEAIGGYLVDICIRRPEMIPEIANMPRDPPL
jgi:hypothetical protein